MTGTNLAGDFVDDSGVRIFAPPKKIAAILFIIFLMFSAMGISSIWVALANSDGSFARPVMAAILFGGVFGGFTLLSGFVAFACRRTRLHASSARVRLVTALRDRTIALRDVTHARWRTWPGSGSLVLSTATGRMAIDFGGFSEPGDLVRFFRGWMPAEIQENYEQFAAQLAVIRPPLVIRGRTTLLLSAASLVVAILFCALFRFYWVRLTWGIPAIYCLAVTMLTAIDFVRRRERMNAISVVISLAAIAWLGWTLTPAMMDIIALKKQ